jgi:hypothetical protein
MWSAWVRLCSISNRLTERSRCSLSELRNGTVMGWRSESRATAWSFKVLLRGWAHIAQPFFRLVAFIHSIILRYHLSRYENNQPQENTRHPLSHLRCRAGQAV